MYAIIRENCFAVDSPLEQISEFQEFQKAHANVKGYIGSIVVEAGEGRYESITVWASNTDMNAAREALGPVVGRLLEPLMTRPSEVVGAGRVVFQDVMPPVHES
jgi:hypothetical protein